MLELSPAPTPDLLQRVVYAEPVFLPITARAVAMLPQHAVQKPHGKAPMQAAAIVVGTGAEHHGRAKGGAGDQPG